MRSIFVDGGRDIYLNLQLYDCFLYGREGLPKSFPRGEAIKFSQRPRNATFRSRRRPAEHGRKEVGRGRGCCYFKTFQTMILPVSIQPPHSLLQHCCACVLRIVDTFYWLLQKFNILLPSPPFVKFVELLFLERIIRCFAKFGIGQLCDKQNCYGYSRSQKYILKDLFSEGIKFFIFPYFIYAISRIYFFNRAVTEH